VSGAVDVLREVCSRLEIGGPPLAAANADLAWPTEPLAALWHAATLIREHRGDGQVAALVSAGVDGLGSHVLRTAVTPNEGFVSQMPVVRGWSPEQWAGATEGMRERGLVDEQGHATGDGRQLHAAIEARTDLIAGAAWVGVDVEALDAVLRPLAEGVIDRIVPLPNPVGNPRP
jgi:hypothetical protein